MHVKNRNRSMILIVLSGYLLFSQNAPVYGQSIVVPEPNRLLPVKKAESPLEVINLSLEEAIQITLEDNPFIEEGALNLEKVQVDYEKQKSALKKNEGLKAEKLAIERELNKLQLEVAKSEYKDIVATQKIEIEKMYFEVLHGESQVEIYKENFDLAGKMLNRAKRELEAGIATKEEVDRSELNYIKAQKELYDAEIQLQTLKMSLNQMLGFDITRNTILTDKLDDRQLEAINIDEMMGEVYEKRTEFKKAQLAYNTTKYQMDTTKGQYPENTFQYREKNVALKKAEKALAGIKKEIEKDVRIKYNQVIQKYEAIKVGEKSVALTQKMLDSTTLMYELGLKEYIQVQEVQAQLKLEKLALAENILSYNIAVLAFRKSIGNEI